MVELTSCCREKLPLELVNGKKNRILTILTIKARGKHRVFPFTRPVRVLEEMVVRHQILDSVVHTKGTVMNLHP